MLKTHCSPQKNIQEEKNLKFLTDVHTAACREFQRRLIQQENTFRKTLVMRVCYRAVKLCFNYNNRRFF
jgi:hypothetical protein